MARRPLRRQHGFSTGQRRAAGVRQAVTATDARCGGPRVRPVRPAGTSPGNPSGDVYAVGSALTGSSGAAQALILRWNGTAWSQQDTAPTGGTLSVLYAAAAVPGAAQEWAAGFDNNGPDQALVLSYS